MNKDMQVNVVAEVKSFFDSVYNYTDVIYDAYVDESDKARVAKAIQKIRDVQIQLEQLYKIDDKFDLSRRIFTTYCHEAFIKPNQYVGFKNKPYLVFSGAVNEIINYYSNSGVYNNRPDKVLKKLNKWKANYGSMKRVKPQLNVEMAVDKFFESVDAYTRKISALYTDEHCLEKIGAELAVIEKKKQQVAKLKSIKNWNENYNYANRVKYGDSYFNYVFRKPNCADHSAGQAFLNAFYAIVDFYTNKSFDKNPEPVLMAIKKWNYAISTSAFKDFVYPFIPLTRYAKTK